MGTPHQRLWLTVALCLTAGSIAAPAGAAAQEPSDETLLFQDLARVTGASRYEQDTRDAPASITIITAEEIRRYGYRTLGEALANVRGFVVNDDRNYSYLGVRGFAVPGDFNSRVLLLVDGHRVNDGVYQSALIEHGALIDLRVVDRIEIVRGPSSSVYGTSALFGVVNIVTLRGRSLNGAEVGTSIGSWGSYRGSVAAGRRFAGGAEMLFAASGFRSAGENIHFPELDAPATNGGWAVGVDGDRYNRQFAKLAWGDWTVEAGRNWREKHVPTGSYQSMFNDPRTTTVDEHSFAFARVDHGFVDASRLEATLGYHAYAYRGRYAYPEGLFGDYGIARWWSLDGQYVRTLGRHHVVAGTDIRWDAHQDQGGENVDSGTMVFRSRRNGVVWAVFAQDEWRVTRHVLLTAGVRHDHYQTFGGTTNPRASLVYQLGRIGALKMLYGRAFRAPNAYELDYQDGGLSTKAPASLRPETVESYEVVFEGVPRAGLRVTASAYVLHLRDLVTQAVDPADSLLVYRNAGHLSPRGFELEVDVRLTAGVNAGFSYANQDVDDPVTGVDVPGAPSHVATARLSVPAVQDRVRASLAARYVSAQRSASGAAVRARTVADLTILARPATRLTVGAGIYNVFDASHTQPGGSEQVVGAIPQSRRNARVGLLVQF